MGSEVCGQHSRFGAAPTALGYFGEWGVPALPAGLTFGEPAPRAYNSFPPADRRRRQRQAGDRAGCRPGLSRLLKTRLYKHFKMEQIGSKCQLRPRNSRRNSRKTFSRDFLPENFSSENQGAR
jgi:hypothetical protein